MRAFQLLGIIVTSALAFAVSTGSASAQSCSVASEDALATCAQTGADQCRAQYATCVPLKRVLTTVDVREDAVARCCGKKKKSARKVCLLARRNSYLVGTVSSTMKAFTRAARSEVNEVLANDCFGQAYSQAF